MNINLKIFLLFFIVIGSQAISSTITITDEPPKNNIPNVSGEWAGEAKDNSTKYSISALFTQDAKGNLDGYFLWKDEYGGSAKEIIKGKINIKGSITLIGTSLNNVINKFPDGAWYVLGNYTAILSKDEKTITGKWKSVFPGDFKLIKKKK